MTRDELIARLGSILGGWVSDEDVTCRRVNDLGWYAWTIKLNGPSVRSWQTHRIEAVFDTVGSEVGFTDEGPELRLTSRPLEGLDADAVLPDYPTAGDALAWMKFLSENGLPDSMKV